MGPDELYTMFSLNGRQTGAAYTMKAEDRAIGIPPNWLLYISVDNADDTVARALDTAVPTIHEVNEVHAT